MHLLDLDTRDGIARIEVFPIADMSRGQLIIIAYLTAVHLTKLPACDDCLDQAGKALSQSGDSRSSQTTRYLGDQRLRWFSNEDVHPDLIYEMENASHEPLRHDPHFAGLPSRQPVPPSGYGR